MITTIFLAQVWGPVILAVALGVFMSRSFYIKIYRDLDKEVLSVLTFGMLAMALGIIQISIHNTWDTLAEIIVSFLGWGLLVKGALFIMVPNFVDRVGDGWVNLRLIPLAGTLMLLIGGYLTMVGYFL